MLSMLDNLLTAREKEMENKDGFLVIRREMFMRVTGATIREMVKA